MLQHQNVINSWPKVRLNPSQIETVCVIETYLPQLPDYAAYDHEAFNGFVEAIRSWLAEHPSEREHCVRTGDVCILLAGKLQPEREVRNRVCGPSSFSEAMRRVIG